MKLHLEHGNGANVIRAYSQGRVTVNDVVYTHSLVVMPDRLVADWHVTRVDELQATHFARIADLAPEVVLLGTGLRSRFPHPALTAALTDAGIGMEVMDTRAACRTYNILVAEGRRVAAALLLGGDV